LLHCTDLLKSDYSVIYDAKENLKSDRYFNQNQCSIFNFFAKRRLLKDIKNKKQHSGRKLLFIFFMFSGVPVNLITEIF
jgi:hypothetical protein